MRNLLDVASVRALARSAAVRAVAEASLGPTCAAVRGLLFDKTPAANWRVAWHQDVTIAVRERRDVRIHLDDCGVENGPLRVLPGSHRAGRLTTDDIAAWKARVEPTTCVVARGGILAFRLLLLHASSTAMSPARRRVVHLEFAAAPLGDGLRWHTWV